ncbi:MAG: transposase [Pseudomonas sp.]|jgi:REP element-mobilizing transposase RayT|nr:transposase [Pseudomonas sp.]
MPHTIVKGRASTLRHGRFSNKDMIYHVTWTTHQRLSVFNNFHTAHIFAQEILLFEKTQRATSVAWVIMPDHVHWLVQLQNTPLSTLVKSLKARSALAINKSQNKNGKFWQEGFYDRAVRYEDDLKSIARYIIANPIRAGLTKKVGDYPFWDACWL